MQFGFLLQIDTKADKRVKAYALPVPDGLIFHYYIGRQVQEFINQQPENYWGDLKVFTPVINILKKDEYIPGFSTPVRIYRPRKKEVYVSESIDSEEFVKLSDEAIFSLICKSILRCIVNAEELKIKNFNLEAFRKDIENFFIERGWI